MSEMETQNIDDLLGASHQRYFGAGYKQVKHNIENIHINPSTNNFDALVRIDYPASWSSKKTSKELQPHLSTIDVFVIAAQMCDAFISHCYHCSEGASKQAWLRSLTVKAGKDSVLDLSNIPLSGQMVKSLKKEDSLNGFISEFKLSLGGFTLSLEVDHSSLDNQYPNGPMEFSNLNELLGGEKATFYGEQYANIINHIYLNHIGCTEITGQIHIEKTDAYNPNAGLGAAYSGCHNPLNLMICAAQISQVLVYQIDQLSRENTKNLWMRSIKVYCPQPLVKGGGLPIKVETKKTRLIQKGEESWRMAELKATTPIDSEFYMESNVAHEIHESLN